MAQAQAQAPEAVQPQLKEAQKQLQEAAQQLDQKVEKVRRDLERRGVLETVRSEVARGKALEFLIDHATVVDGDGNVIDLTIPELPTGAAELVEDHEAADDTEEGPEE